LRRFLLRAARAGLLTRAAKRLPELFPIVNRGNFLCLVAGPSSSNIPLRWRKPATILEET